tara:strand:- start:126 stop:320 length:195 start_codon:yes stop_codon:yes gene_type:complete
MKSSYNRLYDIYDALEVVGNDFYDACYDEEAGDANYETPEYRAYSNIEDARSAINIALIKARKK